MFWQKARRSQGQTFHGMHAKRVVKVISHHLVQVFRRGDPLALLRERACARASKTLQTQTDAPCRVSREGTLRRVISALLFPPRSAVENISTPQCFPCFFFTHRAHAHTCHTEPPFALSCLFSLSLSLLSPSLSCFYFCFFFLTIFSFLPTSILAACK